MGKPKLVLDGIEELEKKEDIEVANPLTDKVEDLSLVEQYLKAMRGKKESDLKYRAAVRDYQEIQRRIDKANSDKANVEAGEGPFVEEYLQYKRAQWYDEIRKEAAPLIAKLSSDDTYNQLWDSLPKDELDAFNRELSLVQRYNQQLEELIGQVDVVFNRFEESRVPRILKQLDRAYSSPLVTGYTPKFYEDHQIEQMIKRYRDIISELVIAVNTLTEKLSDKTSVNLEAITAAVSVVIPVASVGTMMASYNTEIAQMGTTELEGLVYNNLIIVLQLEIEANNYLDYVYNNTHSIREGIRLEEERLEQVAREKHQAAIEKLEQKVQSKLDQPIPKETLTEWIEAAREEYKVYILNQDSILGDLMLVKDKVEQELVPIRNTLEALTDKVARLKEEIQDVYFGLGEPGTMYKLINHFVLGFDDNEEPMLIQHDMKPVVLVTDDEDFQGKVAFNLIMLMYKQLYSTVAPEVMETAFIDTVDKGMIIGSFAPDIDSHDAGVAPLFNLCDTEDKMNSYLTDVVLRTQHRGGIVTRSSKFKSLEEFNLSQQQNLSLPTPYDVLFFNTYPDRLFSNEDLNFILRFGQSAGVLLVIVIPSEWMQVTPKNKGIDYESILNLTKGDVVDRIYHINHKGYLTGYKNNPLNRKSVDAFRDELFRVAKGVEESARLEEEKYSEEYNNK